MHCAVGYIFQGATVLSMIVYNRFAKIAIRVVSFSGCERSVRAIRWACFETAGILLSDWCIIDEDHLARSGNRHFSFIFFCVDGHSSSLQF